ncbi:MAG: hypothetical protein HOK61_03420 [Alphaproteobacteria bacterium]|jgi:hypothetical protein|nr:hypothetical protein [Alphaproteobacteria bacterium]
MSWDLALPLLVCLVTFFVMAGLFWIAKGMLVDPRVSEGVDPAGRNSDH